MSPDDYQQAWKAQASRTRVTVDADLLLQEVQRNQHDFPKLILLRDLGDVGSSLLMLAAWIVMGVTLASPWSWYLMAPALIWTIGFILAARARRKQIPADPADTPLRTSVKQSLAFIDHRIRLRRTAFWWSILPTGLAVAAFIVHTSWLKANGWLDALTDVNAVILVFLVPLYYFLYHVHQRRAGQEFQPRRQELLTLLATLDESLPEAEPAPPSP